MSVQQKFVQFRQDLSSCLIERDTEVDLAATAIACKEHFMMVGPPGTAKSMLCDAATGWLDDGVLFKCLMSKFTTPEEVFGPIDMQSIKNSRYERLTTGMLPEAHFALLDEIWKASSAINNTLLNITNERIYVNGPNRMVCPLRTLFGASNEWPGAYEDGKELGALYDRFLIRKNVKPICTAAGLHRLMWEDISVTLTGSITPAELDQALAEVEAMPWSDSARDGREKIMAKASDEGIIPGDRRVRKSGKIVQAYAYVHGALQVERVHLKVLSHVLWEDPAEQPEVLERIVSKIANPHEARINSLVAEAEQVYSNTNRSDWQAKATAGQKLENILEDLEALGDVASSHAAYVRDNYLNRLLISSVGSMK